MLSKVPCLYIYIYVCKLFHVLGCMFKIRLTIKNYDVIWLCLFEFIGPVICSLFPIVRT